MNLVHWTIFLYVLACVLAAQIITKIKTISNSRFLSLLRIESAIFACYL